MLKFLEVNKPGVYPFSKNLNLEDIIILAGGVRKNATLKSIEVSESIPQKIHLLALKFFI